MKKILSIIALCFAIAQAQAQTGTVGGTITDESGSQLSGATVHVRGTSVGTTSGSDGKYTIKAGKDDVLVFSFLGYATEEEPVGNRSVIDVRMKSSEAYLDEIVVVGYGEQKKASVVGAISSVRSDELKQSATANLSNAIAGRMSGVMTKMISGRPGADASRIFIRGQATTNDATPLVMVDGVEGDFTQIDPDDIESFSVMKDASATAVYGVRGANGVILVTTKRGVKQKAKVSLNTTFSLQHPIRLPKPLDAYNFALLKNEAIRNDGGDVTQYAYSSDEDLEHYRLGDSPYTHPNNDLVDMFLRKFVPQSNTNLSVRGGTDFLKYFVSANYLYQDGIYAKSNNGRYSTNANFQRINLRSNLDFTVTKTTQVSIDFSSSFRDRHNIGLQNRFAFDNGPESNNLFELLLRQPSNYMALVNPDGTYGSGFQMPTGTGMRNPLQIIERGGYYHVDQTELSAQVRLNQKLDFVTKGLSVKAMVRVNSFLANSETLAERPYTREYNKYGEYTSVFSQEELPTLNYSVLNDWIRVYAEASLNYARSFGDHDVTGLLLYNQSSYVNKAAVPTAYLGFVGRVTYGYKNRYLAEINLGYNGSDQFAEGNRYALFPAFSAGWVISEENFWKNNIRAVNFFKLRGSWGMVGNDKLGGNKYLYLQTYNPGNANYGNYNYGTSGTGGVTGWNEGVLGNDRVTWEKAKKLNVGLDMRMFASKFTFSIDYFREMRSDILMQDQSIPSTLGIGTPPANIGRVLNQGGEIEIGYNGEVNDFHYFIRGNASYARNKVLYRGEPKQAYPWMQRTGQSLGQHFGLVNMGLFQSQEEIDAAPEQFGVVQIGDIRYKDLNGDNVINSYDEMPIGYSNVPRWQFGLNMGFSYKNFEFSMLWQGAAQFTAYFEYGAVWEFLDGGNVHEHHLGRFNPEDESTWANATYPRLHDGMFANNHRKSDYWTRKGDYLRLKNVEIGYRIPKKALSRIGISNLYVYISGTNLLTFDYVKTFDPETETVRGYNYPQMALYSCGLNFQF